ncbi:MAG: hypothetical protein ABW022_04875 [Actinoplanes sp.]
MVTDGYPSREDRIVAEFGDGFDVEGIALRYGLTVAQVYAVLEREVGPGYGPPRHLPDDDAIVADYGAGHDVEWIAGRHGVDVERVYEAVRRVVKDA